MSRAELLREIRKMRILEIYEGCRMRRLSYAEAAETLGVSEQTFRRMRGGSRRKAPPACWTVGWASRARTGSVMGKRPQRHILGKEVVAREPCQPGSEPASLGRTPLIS
jgi:hypothetical protein